MNLIVEKGFFMERYNEQLRILQEQIIRKKKLQSVLESLHNQKKTLEEEESRLSTIRRSEETDVERLEGKSLAALFYGVVGKKDEKLTKEREEAYIAAVKHDTVKTQLESIDNDIRKAELEYGRVNNSDRKYDQLLREKMEEVKRVDPIHGAEIFKLEEQISYIDNQIKEINEAISAGNSALSQVRSIESELDSAEGWGTWDLLGGGLISDLAKHSHLDDAQSKVEYLQVLLQRFKTELADITIHSDIQIQIDGFLRFADYFFDGLFADWAVLNRISQSKEQVLTTKSQIQSVLRKLDLMKSTAQGKKKNLKARIDELVINA